ncbi:MAG: SelB C-terminal domain-containing protein, partial [Thermomicrobiales bacterium]
ASPSVTIGGGEVIDAAPVRHRRFRPDVLLSLDTMLLGSPDEIVLQAISTIPRDVKSLRANPPSGLTASQLGDALIQLIAEGDALALGGRDAAGDDLKPADFVIAKTGWETLLGQITGFVDGFHRHTPLRRGMPKEELRSRLALSGPARLFDDAVASAVAERILADDGQTVRRAAFAITLDPPRVVLAARYLAALEAAPFSPPAPAELGVDPDTLGAMVELGRIVKIGDGVYFTPEAAERIETGVLDLIDRDGSVTLAGFRDHFGTSRKYAQAALEHLDLRRVTRRVGDERVRFAGPKPKPTGGPSE